MGNKKEAKTDTAKSETRKPGDQETKLSPQEAPKSVGEWDDAGNDDVVVVVVVTFNAQVTKLCVAK